MTARSEQETTITQGRDEPFVYVYTDNPVHARKLANRASVVKVRGASGEVGGHYRIPADQFDVLTGFKRRKRALTVEQRQAAADRLAHARAAKETAA